MSILLIGYSAQEVRAVEATVGASWWMCLMRTMVGAYRVRRAMAQMRALDDRMLRDLGLTRAGIEHAVRFGRVSHEHA
jgi:uncharacterized protein YjiS (DUF1127 family)